MKVYTRRGDGGETSLFGGDRVAKDATRVAAYGAVDELNAVLGVVCADLADADLLEGLRRVQSSLFDLGGELATPDVEEREAQGKGIPRVADADVESLERWIDRLDEETEPLQSFILPGGARAAATLHLARTVCRRAEREVVSLARVESVSDLPVRYLNRLSDLLFTLARAVNARAGVDEPEWSGGDR
jgi:cob(I)alamin adenosyltransferase